MGRNPGENTIFPITRSKNFLFLCEIISRRLEVKYLVILFFSILALKDYIESILGQTCHNAEGLQLNIGDDNQELCG